ncbi:phosphoglycerate mutase [Sporosarcina sp. NCCP-2222]|uniref:histidine phosphatase family protein n=1 Tax=Sporosarcina sp. NCCP-2222 TaxID=2935073 RepID=UPI00208BA2DC|nr:histidine phosphatase family protein [Sporosarcina sp. NCCP-2222]GKV57256.1 phosphoglycerate mutase [Sporosarcina sp. NCCP-2222]
MIKTIYLVRHCQAFGKEQKAELTEEGKEQAKELMYFFANRNVKRIVSSPFTRALQSVQPLADNLELQLEIDDRLAEHRLISNNLKDWLERLKESLQDLDLKLEGGESIGEVTKSAMELLEETTDGTVLATHRNIIGLILMQIKGMKGIKEWTDLSHPDVYEVLVKNDSYDVRRVWGKSEI